MEEEKNAFTISFTLCKDKSEFMAVFIFFLKSCIFIFKASLFFYSLSKTSQVPPKWVSARAYLPRKFWRVLKVLPLLIHSCVCVCVWGGQWCGGGRWWGAGYIIDFTIIFHSINHNINQTSLENEAPSWCLNVISAKATQLLPPLALPVFPRCADCKGVRSHLLFNLALINPREFSRRIMRPIWWIEASRERRCLESILGKLILRFPAVDLTQMKKEYFSVNRF